MLFFAECLKLCRPDHREHLRAQDRRGHDYALRLTVIAAQIGGEHAVHLAPVHGVHGFGRGRIGDRLEFYICVLKTIRSVCKIILKRACEFTRFRVLCAEGHIVVLIAHPDSSVVLQPAFLVGCEVSVDARLDEIPVGHLLTVVAVLVLYAAQRGVEFAQQVLTLIAEDEVEV